MVSKSVLEQDLHEAMRQKDETVKNTLKILISSIKMAEIEKGNTIDESNILSIIQKEIKMRKESIVEFEKGSRQDLITLANREIECLEKYLPAQLDDSEITNFVKAAIDEVNASTPADMGKVMKLLIPRLSGKAPSDRISAIVKTILTQ